MRWWSPLLLLAVLAYLVLAAYWTDSNRHSGHRLATKPSPQGVGSNDDMGNEGADDAPVDEDDGEAAPGMDSNIFDVLSVYNLGPRGTSQAFAYLERRPGAASVSVLGRRISPEDLPRNGVVFRLATGWSEPGSLEEVLESLEEEEEEGEETPDDTPEDGTSEDDAQPSTPEDGGQDGVDEGGAELDNTPDAGSGEPEPPGSWREPRLLSERQAAWVRRGGRLVIGFSGWMIDLESQSVPAAEIRTVFPLWTGADQLEPPIPRALRGAVLRRSHAIVLLGDEPLISRWPLDDGEVILLAAPEMLQNAHLATADHLALLEALAGDDRPIFFDETLHGTSHDLGTFYLLGRWRLIPALGLWIVACLALWWRHSRAVGPQEDPYQERRSEAVDMVDSLASLYGRALRRRDALELYHRAFVEQVAWRFGLQGDALAARAEALLGGPMGGLGLSSSKDISAGELHRQLERINQAFGRIEHADRF